MKETAKNVRKMNKVGCDSLRIKVLIRISIAVLVSKEIDEL